MKWLRFPRILGVVVCLYLIAMSVVFGKLSTQSYRFLHGAAPVQGVVVALIPQATAGSSRTPIVRPGRTVPLAPTVEYVVEGKTYDYTAAHGRYRQPLRVGDKVTVLYDPTDPSRARLRGEGQILVPLITSGFVTCALMVGALLFLTRHHGQPRRSRTPEDSRNDPPPAPLRA